MERYDQRISPASSDGKQVEETQFGRWIKALNKVFDVTQGEMAMRISYDKGSFSEVTSGKGSMSRQAFNELLRGYKVLAEEKQIAMPETTPLFFSIAWLGEEVNDLDISVIKGAAKALEHIEWLGEVMEEVRQLRKENARFRELKNWKRGELLSLIAQLEAETERLTYNVKWLELRLRTKEDS